VSHLKREKLGEWRDKQVCVWGREREREGGREGGMGTRRK